MAEIMDHLPRVGQDLVDFVENTALKSSRYLFVTRAGSIKFAYCTHCKKQYSPNFLFSPLKHNEWNTCEKCGSDCKVKDAWRGRSKMFDEAYIVWYAKSEVDPKSVVAQGVHIIRDYRGDYKDVTTKFYTHCSYLFEPGDPRAKGKERFGRSSMFKKTWHGGSKSLLQTKSVYTERDRYAKRLPLYISETNITAAVAGTQLQYSQWQKFFDLRESDETAWVGFNTFTRKKGEAYTDMVEFFDLATRYPCTEYLIKLGLESFVRQKLYGMIEHRLINWRGATMDKVLRLTREETKGLRVALCKIDEFTPLSLHSYKLHKEIGFHLSFEQAHMLRDVTFDHTIAVVKELPVPYEAVVKYTLKQMSRLGSKFKKANDLVRTWRDYLADCQKLGMDPQSEAVLYPNDLHKAHQKTLTKVKYKEDKALNEQIAKRLQELSRKYRFKVNGFIIRPAVDSIELFNEGKTLQHCVGSYAKRYAEGKCEILVIRKADSPDKPFYTMEIVGDRVMQCRGFKNCDLTPDVKAFVDQFISKKLLTKKRTRIDVTGILPVAREGVAI